MPNKRNNKIKRTLPAIRTGEADAYAPPGTKGPYRFIVEAMKEGALLTDKNGEILFCNKHFAKMAKQSPNKIVGASLYQFIAPKEHKALKKLFNQNNKSKKQSEFTLYSNKNADTIVQLSLSPLQLNGKQKVYIIIATDITPLKRTEQELRVSEKLYRELFEQSPYGICIQYKGKLVVVNKAFMQILGATQPAQLIAKNIIDFVHPDFKKSVKERLRTVNVKRTMAKSTELKWVRLDNTVVDVEAMGVPYIYKNKLASEGILLDITEKKQTAKYLLMEQSVARILTETSELKAAIAKVLQVICQTLQFDIGGCWLVDPLENTMRFSGVWCSSDTTKRRWLTKNQPMTFKRSVGLPGHVWRTKKIIWVSDITKSPCMQIRKNFAKKLGLKNTFSFPIMHDAKILGSMEFFGKDSVFPTNKVFNKKSLSPILQTIGNLLSIYLVNKQAEQDLRDNEAKYRQLVEASPYGIFIQTDGKIIFANTALAKIFGATNSKALIGKSLTEFIPSQYLVELMNQEKIEYKMTNLVGKNIDLEIAGKAFTYSGKHALQVIVHDITHRKRIEAELVYLASHDPLTGLANRCWLENFIVRTITTSGNKQRFAILFLDLDQFKDVNDTLGHEIGDQLLQAVAKRIHSQIRANDIFARLGGDEFVIILQAITDDNMVIAIIQKIMRAFNDKFIIAGHEIVITTSIGVSLYPKDGDTSQSLLKNADIALYKAKELGRNNFQFCTSELSSQVRSRISLGNALRSAVIEKEFLLYYQPKVAIKTNKIIGVETILRWQQPNGTIQLPAKFIPLAEDTGLIVAIGEWTLEQACKQHKIWEKIGLYLPNLSVNVSGRQLREDNFSHMLQKIFRQNDFAPHILELELTESILINEALHINNTFKDLKKLGVQLSLDDFGTGYSSLSYLKRFTIDRIKIDRSFVAGIGKDANSAAIIKAIIAMSHSLGVSVIAEGVETQAQLDFLKNHGCDEIQGFYISEPLPADKITEFLRKGWQPN